MKQKNLSRLLKALIIAVGICGLVVYFLAIPVIGLDAAEQNTEYAYCFYPWLVFLWISAVPCYTVLVYAWKIASNIGADRSFSLDNAKYLKHIALLSAADTAFFFVGNIVYWALNMSHPSVFLFSLLVCFIGLAITIAFAALSHLVLKAAALQEQSDLTI